MVKRNLQTTFAAMENNKWTVVPLEDYIEARRKTREYNREVILIYGQTVIRKIKKPTSSVDVAIKSSNDQCRTRIKVIPHPEEGKVMSHIKAKFTREIAIEEREMLTRIETVKRAFDAIEHSSNLAKQLCVGL